jgi:hypothetical protein
MFMAFLKAGRASLLSTNLRELALIYKQFAMIGINSRTLFRL